MTTEDDEKKREQKTKFVAFDLELNQPSQKIIQIGAVIGDLKTGEILSTFNRYCSIDEPLDDFVSRLCRIPESLLESEGVSLIDAYRALEEWVHTFDVYRSPLTWGTGDFPVLFNALKQTYPEEGFDENWIFGRRYWDSKTVYQSYMLSQGEKTQAGLARALTRLGMSFRGAKHNALDDAWNTFAVHARICALMGKIRPDAQDEKSC